MLAVGPIVVTADLGSPFVDGGNPLHLDGLLILAACQREGLPPLTRFDELSEIRAPEPPLHLLGVNGAAAWLCSAAEPIGPAAPERVHIVKRRDAEDWDRLADPVTVVAGPQRDRLVHAQAVVAAGLRWHAWGQAGPTADLLCELWGPSDAPFGFVGSMMRAGAGQITEWRVDIGTHAPERCLLCDGCAARHLPAAWVLSASRWRRGASRPPYWHPERQEAVPWLGVPVELRPEVHAALTRIAC